MMFEYGNQKMQIEIKHKRSSHVNSTSLNVAPLEPTQGVYQFSNSLN